MRVATFRTLASHSLNASIVNVHDYLISVSCGRRYHGAPCVLWTCWDHSHIVHNDYPVFKINNDCSVRQCYRLTKILLLMSLAMHINVNHELQNNW